MSIDIYALQNKATRALLMNLYAFTQLYTKISIEHISTQAQTDNFISSFYLKLHNS